MVSRKRGRPSNHAYPADLRDAAIGIIRERYPDFGPTLAAEKLAAHHGCSLSRETLRGWMIADGLWRDRRHRLPSPHQPRRRRDCLGELVQIDGCEHWWFEDRVPQCTLLVFVDDATSRLMHLQFVESESTFAYFNAARGYLKAWGKPIAFYSDKHGVFRVNHPGALGGDGMTQFGRALHALNIDIICANSSTAKGRVERAHKTAFRPGASYPRVPCSREAATTPALAEQNYPCVAWLPTAVIVICPIVVLALAPCQWRSPALICTTSPTLISRCSCSFATMPEPEVTISTWSQLCVCHPVVQPWLKLTTLQL